MHNVFTTKNDFKLTHFKRFYESLSFNDKQVSFIEKLLKWKIINLVNKIYVVHTNIMCRWNYLKLLINQTDLCTCFAVPLLAQSHSFAMILIFKQMLCFSSALEFFSFSV